ncbi:MAG: NUDIX domain-containing protein [Promethearchaeota archaeon]
MKREHSIAAVLVNEDQYLLLKYGMGHWGLVKGNQEEGETDKQTILRELKEETGISEASFIKGFKEEFSYHYRFKGNLIFKTVTCYLIRTKIKDVVLSFEHTEFKWLPYEKAIKKATFDGPKTMMEKAKNFLSRNLDAFL